MRFAFIMTCVRTEIDFFATKFKKREFNIWISYASDKFN